MVRAVVTCRDRETVVSAVAARLWTAVRDLQSDPHRVVQICLAGGGVAHDVYRRLATSESVRHGIDWPRVELWWGDERFVPTDSPDRNAGQSLAALAAHIPLDPARVHPMPSSDSVDLRQAAAEYASELDDTVFDICLLGMGGDGHVASLFPGHPSFDRRAPSRVVGVTDSPKPPPERLSLTVPTINESAQVWLVVAGGEKADAVTRAIGGDQRLPAAAVAGRDRTVWFLDADAAAGLD